MADSLLERAFRATYGFRLDRLASNLEIATGTFRFAVRKARQEGSLVQY